MIVGEGTVFFFLLCFGAYHLHKSINKQMQIKDQQRNFLLSVTHELKSPLASIKLYLQTILKRDLDLEKQKTFIYNSLEDIERLNDLVEKMLLATKIENHTYKFPKENFDFSELVESLSDRIRRLNDGKRIFVVNVQKELFIKGDRFALGSLVNNLLENAILYSDLGSEIFVELIKENNQIILRIADQGIGINEQYRKRIFDKFFRIGDEETRKTQGTGLGLFIVKQVAEHHKADIIVKSNNGVGTIFEIVFSEVKI